MLLAILLGHIADTYKVENMFRLCWYNDVTVIDAWQLAGRQYRSIRFTVNETHA